MPAVDLTSHALKTLLSEAFFGGRAAWAWFLNAEDPGLIPLLRSISPAEASQRPGPDRKSIAAHAAHILYHLELIDRVRGGDLQAFATADWIAAWKLETVDATSWNTRIDQLEKLARSWIDGCVELDVSDEVMLTGSLASPVHFAYHLGSIRQILLSVRESKERA